jgi:uncharacterized membrane protein YfcA
MLGVLAGALVGARMLKGASSMTLRYVFAAVVGVIALEMLYKGSTGGF